MLGCIIGKFRGGPPQSELFQRFVRSSFLGFHFSWLCLATYFSLFVTLLPLWQKKRLQQFHIGERTRSTLPQTINQQSLPHYDRTNGDQSLKPGDCFTGLSQMMPSVHQSVVSWLQFTGICCLYPCEDYTCPTSLTPALAIACSGHWHWNTNYQHSSSESDIVIECCIWLHWNHFVPLPSKRVQSHNILFPFPTAPGKIPNRGFTVSRVRQWRWNSGELQKNLSCTFVINIISCWDLGLFVIKHKSVYPFWAWVLAWPFLSYMTLDKSFHLSVPLFLMVK